MAPRSCGYGHVGGDMRGLLTALVAAASFLSVSAAQATVLTFETPVTDYFANTVGPYPGLTFQYFKTINATNFPESGYTNALKSGNQVACGCASDRSEERRVGKEGVSTCRYRWSP